MQNDKLAAAAVQIALSHVGMREATGHNDGTFVDTLEKKFGTRGQPWCAMYATECIFEAAAKLGVKTKLHKSMSSSEIYHQGKAQGLSLSTPVPYCLGLVKGGTQGRDHHHTFFVLSVDKKAGIVHTVDGNYGNAVMKTSHPISACDFVAVA
jgi:hypothetical protein